MDPALSSHAPAMTTEFGYCFRTSISTAVDAGSQVSTEVREVCHSQPSSSPSRKKTRFFDTLRLKSTRNTKVADENGSPKSLKKTKSMANILPFSSTCSRSPPDSSYDYHSFRSKRSKTTSPLKRKPILQNASSSRLNRRKSLGQIWGTISSRISPRRGYVLLHPSADNGIQINHGKPGPQTCVSGLNVDSKQPQTPRKPSISSSTVWHEGSTRISTPVDRDESKTPNSYLNLLIASHDNLGKNPEPETPDSYLEQLLEAHTCRVDRYARSALVPNLNFSQEQSPFWGTSTQVEDSEDEEEFSLPPPYILDHFSDVEIGEVELREDSQSEQPDDSGNRAILPQIEVREVYSFEESPNIDTEFYSRGYGHTRINERIEKSIKLTVAKMTKNFHMATSSAECSGGAATVTGLDECSFERDQMEVWDSIIMGSRILQKTTPFRPLRSFPSKEKLHFRNPSEELVPQKSIELRKLFQCSPIESRSNRGGLVLETSNSLNSRRLQRTHSGSKRKRNTSSTLVTVEFPKTVNLGAHTEIYESKSKAIDALYEYKLSELSNFCTYDPSTHTIVAHALESSVPNPADLKQAGFDVLWFPMQKDSAQLIGTKENKEDELELPLMKKDSFSLIGEDRSAKGTKGYLDFNDSGHSLHLNTLSAQSDKLLAANLYSLDRRGSEFEFKAEFNEPHQSPSSKLVIGLASSDRDDEAWVFDNKFFLEFDPNMARSFLGSQYAEPSRSSSPNCNPQSSSDLLRMDYTEDVLYNLDENEEVKPVKTWAELGREYLAKHPAPTYRTPEDDHKVTDEDSNCSASKGDKTSSRKCSSAGPSAGHAEDVNSFEKDRLVRRQFEYQPSVSSNLTEYIVFRGLEGEHCRFWSNSPQSASKQTITHPKDMVHSIGLSGRSSEIPEMDSGELHQFPAVKDSLFCEVSVIPFPTEELGGKPSLRSCISHTSVIEAKRAQERLYQKFSHIAFPKVEVENEEYKAVIEICGELKHTSGAVECSSEPINTKLKTLAITGPQPQCQDGQLNQDEKKTGIEGSGHPRKCRQSSTLSLASGFRFTAYSEQMAGEKECHSGEEITSQPASTNPTSTSGSPSLEAKSGLSILAFNDDLSSSSNGDSPEVKCIQTKGEPSFDELAPEDSMDTDLRSIPRDLHQNRSFPWEAVMENMNIRVVGGAATQISAAKQESRKIGALIDIFQARGLMQSNKPALHRSGGYPATPTARIITPSGGLYHPAGTVCVAAGRPLSVSRFKRVPTPHSPIVRPSSGHSSIDTDVSSMFGESLERSGKHSEKDEDSDTNEEM